MLTDGVMVDVEVAGVGVAIGEGPGVGKGEGMGDKTGVMEEDTVNTPALSSQR